ncbi:MAG: LD-carboxypeptidase [Lachnospiraceae bacterium]|nr:LD-carboxypeptidase [Lachnospiraceae bacterium]
MRYPKFLQKGGRIGFIAPSFGCATQPYISLFEKAKERFSKQGYITTEGPNCHASCGIGKSNLPSACGAEINDFFLNDKCDVIISCGGGETMCEDLPFVDFDGIAKAEPKWYMGYSDNTNLTYTLPVLCDIAAVYGPCVSSFGMEVPHRSINDAFGILTGEVRSVTNYDKWELESLKDEDHPFVPYNLTEDFNMRIYRGGRELTGKEAEISMSGRLIGGCMDCLVNLIGTRFDRSAAFSEKYKADGIIWFIEACDYNVMDCRRALWQMNEAGWFKNVKGFLIGRPMNYNDEFAGYDMRSAFNDMLAEFDVPVLLDLDIGHLPPMMPIVSGAVADVTAKNGALSIVYSYR